MRCSQFNETNLSDYEESSNCLVHYCNLSIKITVILKSEACIFTYFISSAEDTNTDVLIVYIIF